MFVAIAWLYALTVSGQLVVLNDDGRDSSYVQNIVNRSQKIVDGLQLDDKKTARNVRNIIANRYFLLNDIHSKYDKTQQEALDAELYKHLI